MVILSCTFRALLLRVCLFVCLFVSFFVIYCPLDTARSHYTIISKEELIGKYMKANSYIICRYAGICLEGLNMTTRNHRIIDLWNEIRTAGMSTSTTFDNNFYY